MTPRELEARIEEFERELERQNARWAELAPQLAAGGEQRIWVESLPSFEASAMPAPVFPMNGLRG